MKNINLGELFNKGLKVLFQLDYLYQNGDSQKKQAVISSIFSENLLSRTNTFELANKTARLPVSITSTTHYLLEKFLQAMKMRRPPQNLKMMYIELFPCWAKQEAFLSRASC